MSCVCVCAVIESNGERDRDSADDSSLSLREMDGGGSPMVFYARSGGGSLRGARMR